MIFVIILYYCQIKLPYLDWMSKQHDKQIQSLKKVNPGSLQDHSHKKGLLFPAILVKTKSKKIVQSKKIVHSYIQKSLGYIDKGCYEAGRLKIDGQYGDHRMKLFRKKDRMQYQKNIPSLFSEDLKSALFSYALSGSQQKVISPLTQLNLSPKLKKRGESLNFASTNKNDTNNEEDILELVKSIIQSNQVRKQPNKNQQQQGQQKEQIKKGVQQDLRQQNGHLLYPSLPSYMTENWFKVLDNSTKDGNKVIPWIQAKTQPRKRISHRKQHKHIFRFMEKQKSQPQILT